MHLRIKEKQEMAEFKCYVLASMSRKHDRKHKRCTKQKLKRERERSEAEDIRAAVKAKKRTHGHGGKDSKRNKQVVYPQSHSENGTKDLSPSVNMAWEERKTLNTEFTSSGEEGEKDRQTHALENKEERDDGRSSKRCILTGKKTLP